jgi:D-amino-acid dehydrogenase
MAFTARRAILGTVGGGGLGAVAFLQHNYSKHDGQVPLAKGAKVVVVGSGVVGVTTAYELSKRGCSVRVLEQGSTICGEQSASWGNAGTLGKSKRTVPLSSSPSRVVEGLLMPRSLAGAPSQSGMHFDISTLSDPYFWLWGLTFLRAMFGFSQAHFLESKWAELAAEAQHAVFAAAEQEGLTKAADMRRDGRCSVRHSPTPPETDHERLEPPPALLAREPDLQTSHAISCAVTEEDGQGKCTAFTRGLAKVCERKYGARFDVSTPVRQIVLAADGSVTGVRSADGTHIEADAVVLCAGACVAPIAASVGLYVPVQPLRGYSITAPATASAGGVRAQVIFAPSSLYVSRLGDDLRFSCYGEMTPVCADGPGPPTKALREGLRTLVEEVVPNARELCNWDAAVDWHGARPLTPDCYPLVGPTRVPGLYLNAGHSFNGWRESALSAKVLANSLAGGPAAASAAASRAFDPSRYQPWSS